jgi:hypothetical protein
MHRVRAPVGERGPGGPRGFLGLPRSALPRSGLPRAQLGRSDAKRRTQRSSLHPVAPRRPPTPIFVRSLPPAVRPRQRFARLLLSAPGPGAVGPRLALAAALSDVCLLLCCCRPQLPQPQRRAICGGRHGLAWTALGGLTAPTLASRWDGRSCSLCAERAQRIP